MPQVRLRASEASTCASALRALGPCPALSDARGVVLPAALHRAAMVVMLLLRRVDEGLSPWKVLECVVPLWHTLCYSRCAPGEILALVCARAGHGGAIWHRFSLVGGMVVVLHLLSASCGGSERTAGAIFIVEGVDRDSSCHWSPLVVFLHRSRRRVGGCVACKSGFCCVSAP
jgi:hypothetical protein